MSNETIETKLADLERRLQAVERKSREDPANASWRELFGWSKDDDLLPSAARQGEEWRRRMNAEGR